MNKRLLITLLFLPVVASAELPQEDNNKHMGVATCAGSQCHGSAVPRTSSGVMQNEYVTWTQDDPHSKAWETLNNDLSRAMARRLGLKSATTADICLDCHADNVSTAKRGERFQISDGVSCEACHGGSENWLATHYNVPAVSHSDNLSAGLYPTEEPLARAELCLSCHLGNDDKFATHRIMAAGHPRLSFELDTFTELWRTAGRQPHYQVDNDYADRKPQYSHTYTWAMGVLAESRQRLALIRSNEFQGKGMFPELGLYDCHACHRSMKTVNWRRLPRHGNSDPGLPFLTDGSLVMAMALASATNAADPEEFESLLGNLHAAASDSVPAIQATAADLDRVLAEMQVRLQNDRLRNRERQLLRELLGSGADGNFLDYASAEQAFMAVQMLVFEIGDPDLEAGLDSLGDSLQNDERYSPAQFRRLLAQLGSTE